MTNRRTTEQLLDLFQRAKPSETHLFLANHCSESHLHAHVFKELLRSEQIDFTHERTTRSVVFDNKRIIFDGLDFPRYRGRGFHVTVDHHALENLPTAQLKHLKHYFQSVTGLSSVLKT